LLCDLQGNKVLSLTKKLVDFCGSIIYRCFSSQQWAFFGSSHWSIDHIQVPSKHKIDENIRFFTAIGEGGGNALDHHRSVSFSLVF
jgi:hypothetical protein